MITHARILLPVLALMGLGACQSPRADSAAAAQTGLVGLPKSVLIQCAGAPSRTANADGVEVMTYEMIKLRADPAAAGYGGFHGRVGGFWGGRWGGPGWGYGGIWGDSGGTESRTCNASFTITNGKVSKVVYSSPDAEGISRLDQCYSIIENCVPPPAPSK